MRYQGASGSAKEIIIILAFAAGLVVVFYMLAKREAEAAAEALKKSLTDAASAAGKAVTDTVVGSGQTISQIVSLPSITKDNVTGTLSEDIVDVALSLNWGNEVPNYKFKKDGKYYYLYGCDSTGYNCTKSVEVMSFEYFFSRLPEAT